MMKKLWPALLALALLAGCAAHHPSPDAEAGKPPLQDESSTGNVPSRDDPAAPSDADSLFASLPDRFVFSSGVGAWSTELQIRADGSFSGLYHDTDRGDTGDGYPNGVQYICSFSGAFAQPKQINAYTYSVAIASLETEGTPGAFYDTDGVRYIYSEPYGLDGAEEFLIYLPGAPVADLPEDFLSWVRSSFPDDSAELLPFYGFYNPENGDGFVGYFSRG